MEQAQSTFVARQFENLTNIFYLMVGLPLVAFTWVYLNLQWVQPWGYFADPSWRVFLNAVILVLALALGVLAFIQYRKRYNGLEPQAGVSSITSSQSGDSQSIDSRSIDSRTDDQELSRQLIRKLEVFKSAALQKYLLLTASTVLIIIGFYLSAEEFYAALYGLMIIIFSVHRPTPERFIRDMRLGKEERQALREGLRQGRQQH